MVLNLRITRRQLRKIICELTDAEKNAQGIGVDALKAFLLDELFPKEKQMTIEDAIEQSEGSGEQSEGSGEQLALGRMHSAHRMIRFRSLRSLSSSSVRCDRT